MNDKKKTIMNYVLPSPWMTTAPRNYRPCKAPFLYVLNKALRNNYNVNPSQKAELQSSKDGQATHETCLFRILNRNTLVLIFPNMSSHQIDRILSLCNNNLSEAINVLKIKDKKSKIRAKKLSPTIPATTVNTNAHNNEITYIPTKYKDVHIVEMNSNDNGKFTKISNHARILRAEPEKVSSSFRLPLPKMKISFRETSNGRLPVLTTTFPSNDMPVSSSSQTYELQNMKEKPQLNSLSDPNEILERTLTLYPSYCQDNI